MTISPPYRRIVEHYEACLERHGDTHLGVDWPKAEDVDVRHRVMLDVIRPRPAGATVSLLDFGCGASHLYEHLRREGRTDLEYAGLDLSPRFVELSPAKFPENRYWQLDVLADDLSDLPRFDYAVLNGVFTEKLDLSFEMLDFFERTVTAVFGLVDDGIAFNVMSKHVDWEREDLFHLPLDTLGAFLTGSVSRNFVVRSDYGLYEYTTYVYR
jgi:SAM-dependent methyltransferase